MIIVYKLKILQKKLVLISLAILMLSLHANFICCFLVLPQDDLVMVCHPPAHDHEPELQDADLIGLLGRLRLRLHQGAEQGSV